MLVSPRYVRFAPTLRQNHEPQRGSDSGSTAQLAEVRSHGSVPESGRSRPSRIPGCGGIFASVHSLPHRGRSWGDLAESPAQLGFLYSADASWALPRSRVRPESEDSGASLAHGGLDSYLERRGSVQVDVALGKRNDDAGFGELVVDGKIQVAREFPAVGERTDIGAGRNLERVVTKLIEGNQGLRVAEHSFVLFESF